MTVLLYEELFGGEPLLKVRMIVALFLHHRISGEIVLGLKLGRLLWLGGDFPGVASLRVFYCFSTLRSEDGLLAGVFVGFHVFITVNYIQTELYF